MGESLVGAYLRCGEKCDLDGLQYGSSAAATLAKIRQKVKRATTFVGDLTFGDQQRRFEWWSTPEPFFRTLQILTHLSGKPIHWQGG